MGKNNFIRERLVHVQRTQRSSSLQDPHPGGGGGERRGRHKMKSRKVNSRKKIKEYSHFTTGKENFAVCPEENVSDK